MATHEQIIKRLRRKVEIVRMDRKSRNDVVYQDMNEMLTLLEMLERAHAREVVDGQA